MSTLAMILIITTFILILTAILIWSVLSFTDLQDSNYDKEMMEDWNYFKWMAYGVSTTFTSLVSVATWRPKSGIDKEIAEEEKEIAELERQKEKINTLAELKRRKERLFDEVHEGGEWTDEDESYHCYRCDSFIVGLDNFYKHHKEWHK